MKKITRAGAVLLLAFAGKAQAGIIRGGSELLDASGHAQLERWLGQGGFDLSNVFTRQDGDTAADFHAAADGRGPTFTLMEVINESGRELPGRWPQPPALVVL